jgi:RNA polymerase sigma-70 factor (ECF subfamily)
MGIDLKSLFVAHEREVGSFLQRRVRHSTEVADLSQETFLRVAGMRNPEAIKDARGFLFTVAENLSRYHLRLFMRRERVDAGPADETLVCPLANPEETLCNQQQHYMLRQAIESLPERTREIFLLYHIEGRSYREIAETLELSPRTVEYRLRQALGHCREYARRTGEI